MKYLVELTRQLLADLIETRKVLIEERERLRRNRQRRGALNEMLRVEVSLLRNHNEQMRLRNLPSAECQNSVSTVRQVVVGGGGVPMPWRNNAISYPFDIASVILNAPQDSGVYALRDTTIWVYIGESKDILAQLVQHIKSDRRCIKRFPNLTFTYELSPSIARTFRMNELIREFRPVCQSMLG